MHIRLTKFEWILLISSYTVILVFFIFAPFFQAERNFLSLISALVGIFGILLMAKGLIAAHFVYIAFSILYSILSITQNYYGEAIIYCCLMIPIHIGSIVVWSRSKTQASGEAVKVAPIKKGAWVVLIIASFLSVIPFYFLLKVLHTENLLVSTASITMNCLASALMLKRNHIYALCFVIDDSLLILLWGLKLFGGTISLVPTMVNMLVMMVNDIYAFVRWTKRYRQQREKEKEDERAME